MLHDIVLKGSTDRSVTVRIIDSADGTPETGVVFNTSGIDLWYRREGAALVSITEATLAALTTAHADGGFLHVGNGVYRLDLPDAAFATGANSCDFGGTVTGMVVIGGRVRLVDVNLEVTNIPANVVQISGDSGAADNLETAFDDTAGPVPWLGIVDQGTAQSATSTGLVLRAAAAFADDTLIGAILMVFGSTQGYWQSRQITDSALSGDTVTVDAWTVTPSGTITYKIFAGPAISPTYVPAVNVTQVGGAAAPALVGGRFDASVGAMAANVLTATAINADALTAAKVAADVGTEIATAVWANGTRVLTAGTNLNDLSAAGVRTAVGLASANLDTQIADLPTNAELATALASADDAVLAAVATVDTVVDAIQVVTDKLSDTLEDAGGGAWIFTVAALAQAPSGTGASAATIADAVWDELLSGHVGAGGAGEALADAAAGGGGLDAAGVRAAVGLATANLDTQLAAIQGDTNDLQTRVPAALVSGRMDASVGAMAANVMTAAAAASDLTTELQSGLATAAALTTAAGEVTAVKAKTDQLAFTSNRVHADAKAAAGVVLQTNGSGTQSIGGPI